MVRILTVVAVLIHPVLAISGHGIIYISRQLGKMLLLTTSTLTSGHSSAASGSMGSPQTFVVTIFPWLHVSICIKLGLTVLAL